MWTHYLSRMLMIAQFTQMGLICMCPLSACF